MYNFYVLEHPFLLVASFLDSIIRRFGAIPKKINLLIVFLLNMLFNICFSAVVGGVLSIFLSALLITFSQNTGFTSVVFMAIPLFLFTFFSCIILLNWNNPNFSLPWYIFIFYGMFVAARPKKHFLQTIFFLVLVTFVLTLILSMLISVLFSVTTINVSNLLVAALAIALITTVLLYSYGTLDELTRVRRQFILWFIILLGVLFFSAYQLKINLNEPLTNQIHIGSVLLLLTFIYSMITVVDKGIELFKLLLNYYGYVMEEIWDNYTSRYSVDVFTKKVIRTKDGFFLTIEWMKFFWRTGAISVLVSQLSLGLAYICGIGTLIYIMNTNIIDEILSYLKTTTLAYLSITEKQAQYLFFFIASVIFVIWNLASIRFFKKANWTLRIQIFGRIYVSVILLLAILYQTKFGHNDAISKLLYYLLLIFGIAVLLVAIIHKIHKLIKWLKS